eukprot:TRINITY_DN9428_c0_g1_i1.p1 TRINITY_DN9428_c0_g1~~TRINITY_DN9428_c0_g1_i1.p1  ORF type:complete len:631 (+),score=77.57 TRINITY_DN9428_c0_g1_i1:66-1895(+)
MSFVFWCLHIEYFPSIWYIPLNNLSVSDYGEEFYYFIAYFCVFLFLIPKFSDVVYKTRVFGQLLVLAMICTHYLDFSIMIRGCLLCLGYCCGILVKFASLYHGNTNDEIWSSLLGLFLMVSVRFYLCSLTPFLISLKWCLYLTVFGVISCLFLYKEEYSKPIDPSKTFSLKSEISYGIAYGALYFLYHWLCTYHSVFPRWIELHPFPYGIGMIVAFSVGIFLTKYDSINRSWIWWLIAMFSALFIVYYPVKEIAIFGGYIVIAYVVSLWDSSLTDLTENTRLKVSIPIASVVYTIGHLGIIWSVAFKFVPEGTGGPFMRERVTQVLYIFLALSGLSISYKTRENKMVPKKVLFGLFLIILFVTTPAVIDRSDHYQVYDGHGVQTDHIRGMIWAIHFGYDNHARYNFYEVKEMIQNVGANVVSLVETDLSRPFNGNRDIIEFLEKELHYYTDFGPKTLNETWGCAILSVFPIVKSDRIALPSPDGENACLIDATLDVNGVEVDVIVSHFGNKEDTRDRELQTRDSALRGMRKVEEGRKGIWLGYLTTKPHSFNYNIMTKGGWVDINETDQDRWCEYIFTIGMEPRNFEKIDSKNLSDTEVQVANFYIKDE